MKSPSHPPLALFVIISHSHHWILFRCTHVMEMKVLLFKLCLCKVEKRVYSAKISTFPIKTGVKSQYLQR